MRAFLIRLGTWRRELAVAAAAAVLVAAAGGLWASGLLAPSREPRRDGRQLVELQRDEGTPAACRRAVEELWSTAGSRIPAGFVPRTTWEPGTRPTTTTAPDEADRAAAARATTAARQKVEAACP